MRLILLLLLAAALCSGCASVTSGKSQSLTVQAVCGGVEVVDASCKLANDKGQWRVTTPGSVLVHKAYGDLSLECTKSGLSPASGSFQSSSNGGVWGNILLGGVIGYAVDAGSGAGFDYPQSLTVVFAPPCEAEPASQTLDAAAAAPPPG